MIKWEAFISVIVYHLGLHCLLKYPFRVSSLQRVNINLGPQQKSNTSNPWLNLILIYDRISLLGLAQMVSFWQWARKIVAWISMIWVKGRHSTGLATARVYQVLSYRWTSQLIASILG